MRPAASSTALAVTLVLGACAVAPPPGPSVMGMPGQGKSFEAFQQDDAACRAYASAQTGGASPAAAASQSAVGSAVLGTAPGAAIGSVSGAAGAGAAIGGATGLLAGSAIGANNAALTAGSLQQAYDIGYTQCMYGHGDTVQAPPVGYAAYPAPHPYPYAYPYDFFAPSVVIGSG